MRLHNEIIYFTLTNQFVQKHLKGKQVIHLCYLIVARLQLLLEPYKQTVAVFSANTMYSLNALPTQKKLSCKKKNNSQHIVP